MKKTASAVNLGIWLAVTLLGGAVFVVSRMPDTPSVLDACSIVCAPLIACGIGAVLGGVFVLAYNVTLKRWVRRVIWFFEALLLAWVAVSFFSVPAFSEGVPLPPFALSVLFHSFPMLFVLWGFACGVAFAPAEAAKKNSIWKRLYLASPFSKEEKPRRNAWHNGETQEVSKSQHNSVATDHNKQDTL